MKKLKIINKKKPILAFQGKRILLLIEYLHLLFPIICLQ